LRRNGERFRGCGWRKNGRLRHWRVDKFRGNVGEIWTDDQGWGVGFCWDWRYGVRVIVVMGNRVVGRVKEVFRVIGVNMDSGAGVFKVNGVLEF